MKLDLGNELELRKAKMRFDFLIKNKYTIELKKLSSSRSSQQNRALHKFFIIISSELNDLGMEFHYFGVKGQELTTRYTAEIVKNHFWRPIQQTLFNIDSTRKINTKQMNEIIDVVVKFFAEQGIYIEFPNIELIQKK